MNSSSYNQLSGNISNLSTEQARSLSSSLKTENRSLINGPNGLVLFEDVIDRLDKIGNPQEKFELLLPFISDKQNYFLVADPRLIEIFNKISAELLKLNQVIIINQNNLSILNSAFEFFANSMNIEVLKQLVNQRQQGISSDGVDVLNSAEAKNDMTETFRSFRKLFFASLTEANRSKKVNLFSKLNFGDTKKLIDNLTSNYYEEVPSLVTEFSISLFSDFEFDETLNDPHVFEIIDTLVEYIGNYPDKPLVDKVMQGYFRIFAQHWDQIKNLVPQKAKEGFFHRLEIVLETSRGIQNTEVVPESESYIIDYLCNAKNSELLSDYINYKYSDPETGFKENLYEDFSNNYILKSMQIEDGTILSGERSRLFTALILNPNLNIFCKSFIDVSLKQEDLSAVNTYAILEILEANIFTSQEVETLKLTFSTLLERSSTSESIKLGIKIWLQSRAEKDNELLGKIFAPEKLNSSNVEDFKVLFELSDNKSNLEKFISKELTNELIESLSNNVNDRELWIILEFIIRSQKGELIVEFKASFQNLVLKLFENTNPQNPESILYCTQILELFKDYLIEIFTNLVKGLHDNNIEENRRGLNILGNIYFLADKANEPSFFKLLEDLINKNIDKIEEYLNTFDPDYRNDPEGGYLVRRLSLISTASQKLGEAA